MAAQPSGAPCLPLGCVAYEQGRADVNRVLVDGGPLLARQDVVALARVDCDCADLNRLDGRRILGNNLEPARLQGQRDG